MRKHAIVFVDVERDQSTDGRDAVQRVEEEPLMFFYEAACQVIHAARESDPVSGHTFSDRAQPLQLAKGCAPARVAIRIAVKLTPPC